MQPLIDSHYSIVEPKTTSLKHNTVLKTILNRTTPGIIYVDNQDLPGVVYIQFRHRGFIMGDPSSINNIDFERFFNDFVFKYCLETRVSLIRLTADNSSWLESINKALNQHHPIFFDYQIYEAQLNNVPRKFTVPANFELHTVNERLLSESFTGKDELLEELCTERESVDAFLSKSFGVSAFQKNTLAGWCLSEYNFQDRCEVGIATMPPFRRQGLAKAMTGKFLLEAKNRGLKTILWHCYKTNNASSQTAISTGFKLVDEHKVLNIYIDPYIGLAVHGNVAFENENYGSALGYFQQALKSPDSQAWIAWNSACAAAHLSLDDQVFCDLNLAIDLGFDDQNRLFESEHFLIYHDNPRWNQIINRLTR